MMDVLCVVSHLCVTTLKSRLNHISTTITVGELLSHSNCLMVCKQIHSWICYLNFHFSFYISGLLQVF